MKNNKKDFSNYVNKHQIIKKHGRDCFVEASSYPFGIDRVLLKFAKYDPKQGNKMTSEIDIYFKFEEIFTIYDGLFQGGSLRAALLHKKKEALAAGNKYPEETIISRGGSGRGDSVIAKTLKISSGNKLPYVFKAEQGPGKRLANGLITHDGRPSDFVMLALTHQDTLSLFVMIVEQIRAYLVAKEMIEFQEKYVDNRNHAGSGNQNTQKTAQQTQQQAPQQQTQQQYQPPKPQQTQQQYQPQQQQTQQQPINHQTAPSPQMTGDLNVDDIEDLFNN